MAKGVDCDVRSLLRSLELTNSVTNPPDTNGFGTSTFRLAVVALGNGSEKGLVGFSCSAILRVRVEGGGGDNSDDGRDVSVMRKGDSRESKFVEGGLAEGTNTGVLARGLPEVIGRGMGDFARTVIRETPGIRGWDNKGAGLFVESIEDDEGRELRRCSSRGGG